MSCPLTFPTQSPPLLFGTLFSQAVEQYLQKRKGIFGYNCRYWKKSGESLPSVRNQRRGSGFDTHADSYSSPVPFESILSSAESWSPGKRSSQRLSGVAHDRQTVWVRSLCLCNRR
ncbi:hypothetical protein AVEN_61492-1 [Araneus ventricosus]|uniref:Uncharacterized protein n=1 Tax=Araneus ventricosus TaxID=182803 RepID=A0A4Y2RH64_ARAVE|nr:hypothetical protein AVEN_173482-1 [Araneus ventricosus]GBN74589.1 hypothetical protein AVEN_105301-1 [Araneus ventricosus]GBN75248.1 hypothetical protein AVEN_124702-1 [Araneus ventricosus]GBN75272.1 hypothetical protein AVEN_61492-1 [Araneus ventricosus]